MPKPVPVSSDAASTATGRPPLDAGPRPDPHPFGRLRGLDGLRAIAVLAVVIYHGAAGGLSGGFLGVEVFFVISGYLITALLLAEHRANGRIDPLAFWVRRARRLLPALFVLLGVVLAFAVVVVPEEIARLRVDALAAFAYVTNWHLIAGDQSYFESIGRPSLFVHLWSLAIEEQFYLAWPIVLGVLLVAGRRVALGVTLLGAVGVRGLDGPPVRPGQRSVAGLLRDGHPIDRPPARGGPRLRVGSGGPGPALARDRAQPTQAPEIAGQGSRRDALGEPASRLGARRRRPRRPWSG